MYIACIGAAAGLVGLVYRVVVHIKYREETKRRGTTRLDGTLVECNLLRGDKLIIKLSSASASQLTAPHKDYSTERASAAHDI